VNDDRDTPPDTIMALTNEIMSLRGEVREMRAEVRTAISPIRRPTYVNLAIAAIPFAIVILTMAVIAGAHP
jgi:hypothetical protein